MARKFEYAKDAEDPECDEGPGHLVIVGEAEADVVGHDGHEVDHAHHAPHEFTSVGGSKQPEKKSKYLVDMVT